MKILLLLLLLLSILLAYSAKAFVVRNRPQQRNTPSPQLYSSSSLTSGVIKGETEDSKGYDEGLGGVRLAKENAVKIHGTIQHKPGKAEPVLSGLTRYTTVREITTPSHKMLEQNDQVTIVCTGQGKEEYKDPGETVTAEIVLAPMDAVKDALFAAGSVKDSTKIVINMLGGDDLQLLEVTDALVELVLDLDCNTKAKIEFNSLSHNMFPEQRATVTVVAVEGSSGGKEGVDKSVAKGEVYVYDGKYYTVVEDDINTDIA
jgi:hypothetical protein